MTDHHLTDEELAYILRGQRAARAIIYGVLAGMVAGGVMYAMGWWW